MTAAVAAWSVAIGLGATTYLNRSSTFLAGCLAVGCLAALVGVLNVTRGLYLFRVCAIRSVEVARLLQVAGLTGAASVFIARQARLHLPISWAVLGTLLLFMFLVVGRSLFALWVRRRRMTGRLSREVVLVGDNGEGKDLYRLTKDHPECGLRVVGIVGRPGATRAPDFDVPWLGSIDDLPNAMGSAHGAIVAASAFSPDDLNRVVRNLDRADIHIQLSTGLTGISVRRLRPLPLAREPLFYIESIHPGRIQLLAKRWMDIVLSTAILALSIPLLVTAALAIKRDDRRSPILYKQQRVGRGGRPFTLYKLRTMVPGAADQMDELRKLNQRHGPLFKLANDPRVTAVGRFLRQTSIDELPQLVNVLKGDMSLVGPRPALPAEVANFDPDFRSREAITPGLTGLWQVEARDNPSFSAYRRLDLFYLENWSLLLDIAIIGATVVVVGSRGIDALIGRMKRSGDSRSVQLD